VEGSGGLSDDQKREPPGGGSSGSGGSGGPLDCGKTSGHDNSPNKDIAGQSGSGVVRKNRSANSQRSEMIRQKQIKGKEGLETQRMRAEDLQREVAEEKQRVAGEERQKKAAAEGYSGSAEEYGLRETMLKTEGKEAEERRRKKEDEKERKCNEKRYEQDEKYRRKNAEEYAARRREEAERDRERRDRIDREERDRRDREAAEDAEDERREREEREHPTWWIGLGLYTVFPSGSYCSVACIQIHSVQVYLQHIQLLGSAWCVCGETTLK
jgi:hypothetical protein